MCQGIFERILGFNEPEYLLGIETIFPLCLQLQVPRVSMSQNTF